MLKEEKNEIDYSRLTLAQYARYTGHTREVVRKKIKNNEPLPFIRKIYYQEEDRGIPGYKCEGRNEEQAGTFYIDFDEKQGMRNFYPIQVLPIEQKRVYKPKLLTNDQIRTKLRKNAEGVYSFMKLSDFIKWAGVNEATGKSYIRRTTFFDMVSRGEPIKWVHKVYQQKEVPHMIYVQLMKGVESSRVQYEDYEIKREGFHRTKKKIYPWDDIQPTPVTTKTKKDLSFDERLKRFSIQVFKKGAKRHQSGLLGVDPDENVLIQKYMGWFDTKEIGAKDIQDVADYLGMDMESDRWKFLFSDKWLGYGKRTTEDMIFRCRYLLSGKSIEAFREEDIPDYIKEKKQFFHF